MKQFSKYVGLDVHKETIAVSVAPASGGEVRYFGQIANTPEALTKLVKQLSKGKAVIGFCYEAGPCGYGIYRQLRQMGQHCEVIAPSLIPARPGDRRLTNPSDSRRAIPNYVILPIAGSAASCVLVPKRSVQQTE